METVQSAGEPETAAQAFSDALRRATAVRPVDAADLAPTAADDAGEPREHWVDQLLPLGPRRRRPSVTAAPVQIAARTSMVSEAADDVSCLAVLADLRTDRARGVDDAGRRWTSRVTPSAGGTHSIQPLLMVAGSDGAPSWWRSDGQSVQQIQVPASKPLIDDVRAALRQDAIAACVFAVAEPDLVAARYPNGESLLWRDAGAFLATTQFLALGYGMQSRILGITAELGDAGRRIPAYAVGAVVLTSGGSGDGQN